MDLTQKHIATLVAHTEVGQTLNCAKMLVNFFEDVVEKDKKLDESFKAGYILAVSVLKDMVEVMTKRIDKRTEVLEHRAKSAEEAADKLCQTLAEVFKKAGYKDEKLDGSDDIRSADFTSDEEFKKWFHGEDTDGD